MMLSYRCARYKDRRPPIRFLVQSMRDIEDGSDNVILTVERKDGEPMELLMTWGRTIYLLPSSGNRRKLVGIEGEVL